MNQRELFLRAQIILITKMLFKFNKLVHTSACVHRDMKHAGSLESTQVA